MVKFVCILGLGWIACKIGVVGQCFCHWSYRKYGQGEPKGEICTKPPGENFSEIAQNFYLMIKLVCILGLGWISCNMGVLGAMFWTLVL